MLHCHFRQSTTFISFFLSLNSDADATPYFRVKYANIKLIIKDYFVKTVLIKVYLFKKAIYGFKSKYIILISFQ